ncbi:MAG: hypothetical protein ABIK96_13930, partial [bacterium]
MTCNELQRFWGHFCGPDGHFQPLGVDLGVDLGRGDVGMPQGNLDQPQVPCGVVQPRGERVPKYMGRHGFGDSCLLATASDDPLDLPAAEAAACSGAKQGIFRWDSLGQWAQQGKD